MQLSAPIYKLKHTAKRLARREAIPLHEALDRLAAQEGHKSWSHLAASWRRAHPAKKVMSHLARGDMVLLGARPGHGKTRLGIELAALAKCHGRRGFFFTLDYHEREVAEHFADLGVDQTPGARSVIVDTSDEISADHIIDRLAGHEGPAFVVIDYLQVLDQKRSNPPVNEQIQRLRRYVKGHDAICVVISQLERRFDLQDKAMPDVGDIRLPNPLNTSLFDKRCFLHDGKVRLDLA
ncbi:DNA helicase [Thalassococcus sp. S3]|uniref:DNA helicase n=1 Tax=Thalassococcus sp. S3 TaxID=2017482 RepID=UPI00102412B4|nr:DNA helicase [Thalassococcus sp. S3]QBF32817.1 DNA helicase [Thalassococcus sp. S3]